MLNLGHLIAATVIKDSWKGFWKSEKSVALKTVALGV